VNIAYYSTENDFFQLRPQVFLAQILPGTTSVGKPQLLTSASADVQASPPIVELGQPTFFGSQIGIAVTAQGLLGKARPMSALPGPASREPTTACPARM
jgi:hypothetical protein